VKVDAERDNGDASVALGDEESHAGHEEEHGHQGEGEEEEEAAAGSRKGRVSSRSTTTTSGGARARTTTYRPKVSMVQTAGAACRGKRGRGGREGRGSATRPSQVRATSTPSPSDTRDAP